MKLDKDKVKSLGAKYIEKKRALEAIKSKKATVKKGKLIPVAAKPAPAKAVAKKEAIKKPVKEPAKAVKLVSKPAKTEPAKELAKSKPVKAPKAKVPESKPQAKPEVKIEVEEYKGMEAPEKKKFSGLSDRGEGSLKKKSIPSSIKKQIVEIEDEAVSDLMGGASEALSNTHTKVSSGLTKARGKLGKAIRKIGGKEAIGLAKGLGVASLGGLGGLAAGAVIEALDSEEANPPELSEIKPEKSNFEKAGAKTREKMRKTDEDIEEDFNAQLKKHFR